MSHSPVQQWSILSNVINYVQHSRSPLNFHFVTIKPAKPNKTVKIKDKSETLPKVNLIESSGRSREEYLDRYEGVKTEIVDTTRFDENSDLSITYLGRIDMTQDKDLMVEQRFPVSKSGYTIGETDRWIRMSNTVRCRSKQILYVQIILFMLQDITFPT